MNVQDVLNQLSDVQQEGVEVRLSFENKDYTKMGTAIFIGLLLALILSGLILKKIWVMNRRNLETTALVLGIIASLFVIYEKFISKDANQ